MRYLVITGHRPDLQQLKKCTEDTFVFRLQVHHGVQKDELVLDLLCLTFVEFNAYFVSNTKLFNNLSFSLSLFTQKIKPLL